MNNSQIQAFDFEKEANKGKNNFLYEEPETIDQIDPKKKIIDIKNILNSSTITLYINNNNKTKLEDLIEYKDNSLTVGDLNYEDFKKS